MEGREEKEEDRWVIKDEFVENLRKERKKVVARGAAKKIILPGGKKKTLLLSD
jgi:hypothetical protein